MRYYSNRNYGCRFKEVSIGSCRSLILENELISALILLDKGSDIAEFVYKKTDTDIFWRSPGGLDLLNQPYTGREVYEGGWFEAFPNAGEPCSCGGASLQRFGDARFIPWEYSVIEDSPEKVVIKTFAKSNCLPLFIEKTITIESNKATLRFDEKAANPNHVAYDFTWGHHPNISRPFLDGDCEVEMASGTFHLLKPAENGLTEAEQIGTWPFFTDNGKTIDARRIPSFESEEPELSMLYLSDIGKYARVRNRRTGLSFIIKWDEKIFKGMLMCRAFCQQKWNATFGYRYILCLFFLSSFRACLADALRYDDAIHLEPGESCTTFFEIGIEDEKV